VSTVIHIRTKRASFFFKYVAHFSHVQLQKPKILVMRPTFAFETASPYRCIRTQLTKILCS
jgi:hypothetical protein